MSQAVAETTLDGANRANLPAYDVDEVRADFPILSREVHGKPLVFLDSGASAQKPRAVIDAVSAVYEGEYANIHRGVHYLSVRATQLYDESREKVRAYLNAAKTGEIVFTRNTTEAINLVASSFTGRAPSGGGRDSADRARAPRQYRALATRGRTCRRRGPGRAGG